MCVSMAPAEFFGTRVFLGDMHHTPNGRVHTLGYQNTAQNRGRGPNAMLIHMPSAARMDPRNFLDTSNCPHILSDMVEAVTPRSRGGGTRSLGMPFTKGAQVFDYGKIYTVVLAEDARAIPAALALVPENRRPALNAPLFDFYQRAYPGYTVALFCFDNAEAVEAEPVLMWYKPMPHRGFLPLPAIDCHTGLVPDMTALVDTDHWVLVGSDIMPDHVGSRVQYQDAIPHTVRPYLPNRVMGRQFVTRMPNGDFGWNYEDLLQGREGATTHRRLLPPGLA